MKSDKYWDSRRAKRIYEYQKKADSTADEIANAYIKAANYINSETEKIFRTFQFEGGLSEAEAMKLLNNLPDKVTLKNIKGVINTIADKEKRQNLLTILHSPAYAYRIKRFELLHKDIDTQTEQLAEFEQSTAKSHYINLAEESYNHTIFDIQQKTGFGFSFSQMPNSRIKAIMRENWSGRLFSERIWGRSNKINEKLKQELLTQFLTGRSYRKTAKEIENTMAVGAMEARRLVRTESTYIVNSADMEAYTECGIKKYRFLATLDMRTSEICGRLDGKVFKVSEAQAGTNLPPMHPWCRSTTTIALSEEERKNLKRCARDPETGKTYLVPQNMTYKEWKNSLTKGDKSGIINTYKSSYIKVSKDASVSEVVVKKLQKATDLITSEFKQLRKNSETIIFDNAGLGALAANRFVFATGKNQIVLDKAAFSDEKELLKKLKADFENRISYKTEAIESLVAHELGHNAHIALALKRAKLPYGKPLNYTARISFDNEYKKIAQEVYLEAFSDESISEIYDKCVNDLGTMTYGNAKELIAQSFGNYYFGLKKSDIAQNIISYFKKEL